MMRKQMIDKFVDKNSGLEFCESIAYCEENTHFLFEKNGHAAIVNTDCLEELKSGSLSAGLLQKLRSRGFAGMNGGEQCYDACNVYPEFFMIDLTNKCNMHCKYCLRDVEASERVMSESTLIDICEYINHYCEKEKLKDVSIQPWGGEPLLELSKIVQMRKYVHPRNTKVHFSIETNGVLLDAGTINELYRNRIGIGISIDGYEEVHDAQRVFHSGGKTHRIVEKNLLLAKEKYKDRLGIISTITKNNADKIESILEYFACELKLSRIKLNYVHESMFTDCADMCLSKEQIYDTEQRMLKKLVELNERGYHICEHNIKVKLRNLLYRQYSDICHSRGCMGGRKMIVFDRKGSIYPCELTDVPGESLGSIYDCQDLISLINTELVHKEFFVHEKPEICRECEWYIFCGGGCTVRKMSRDKIVAEIDEIECAVNTILYPALVELVLEKPQIVYKLINEDVCPT